MLHSHKRVLASASLLSLRGAKRRGNPLTETPEAAVPAIETPAPVPSDTIEAETELSLSDNTGI